MMKLSLAVALLLVTVGVSKTNVHDNHRRQLLKHEDLGDVPTHHLGGSTIDIRNLFKTGKVDPQCDPADVNLADYPQWQEEEGFWIGEYTFYQGDGTPFKSSRWNYRYDAYRGFITGNVQGNAYRQRNVFFYPPQFEANCENNNSTQGVGTCGVNGNTKIFAADQQATTCSTNPAQGGDIEGPFAEVFTTTTELVGKDNALLYQVYFLDGTLFQSQLTTLTVDLNGQVRRTRSAQSFISGVPRSMSFYRERKVDEDTFYAEIKDTIEAYNILESDTCTWRDNFTGATIGTGLEPGIVGCSAHLEESFEL